MKSAARWFAAAVLILLGIAGTLLPVVPGFLFFALAIAILASESHTVRRSLRWARRRYPRALRWMRVPRGPTPAGDARKSATPKDPSDGA